MTQIKFCFLLKSEDYVERSYIFSGFFKKKKKSTEKKKIQIIKEHISNTRFKTCAHTYNVGSNPQEFRKYSLLLIKLHGCMHLEIHCLNYSLHKDLEEEMLHQ